VAGLAACSVVSLVSNGTIFWLVVRPLQPLRFRDLQGVNLAASVLNYAPIRAGFIARVAYHLRVDRVPVLRLGAWFAAVSFTMLLALGACVSSSIIWPRIDWVWALLLAGQIALGGGLTIALLSQPIVARYGRGLDVAFRHPLGLWGGTVLRVVDLACFAGRMACAAAILGLPLGPSDIVLLAVATFALSVNPLGRFGFREAGVALTAGYLLRGQMSPEELAGQMEQLALVDSAGEAMVFVPLGCLSLVWYRRRWRAAGRAGDGAADEPADDDAPGTGATTA
jgi:hypothetical protein